MLNINKGKITRPKKVVIYAGEGVGKTTFASGFPDPLFIDTENGTFNLDVNRVDKPTTWQELLDIVKEVATSDVCKTLVIDTVDWAEMLAIADVCEKARVSSLENIAYGKGYTYVADRFIELLKELDKVIDSGKHVVLTAHAKTRKFELPEENGQYDKWEMKLSRQVAPLIKEWSDMLLFGNYKIFVVANENGTKKAQGGKRVLYTSHHPCWDAKNRFDLPEELDLDFASIAHLFKDVSARTDIGQVKPEPKQSDDLTSKVRRLLSENGVLESELEGLVSAKGHYPQGATLENYSPEFITRWIIPNFKKIVEAIKQKNGGNE